MPAGFEFVNNNQNVIIDEKFFNYAFISKHTLTFQQAGGPVTGGFGRQAFLTVAGDRPIVAARCSKPFTVSRARPVAGGWEFGWISVNGGIGAVVGDTIEVFVFDRPLERSGPGFGLQVFGADGRVVFDSQNRYMKVVDARTLEGATPTANVNLGPGNYAQVVTVPGFRWTGVQATPTADWQWACFAGVVTSNGNGYSVAQGTTGEGTYAFFGMPAPRAESARMHIMTVDVTGY
ncbi:hypothetical protein PWP89_12935 [Stenotrophomonas rhizophila]|uniref:hypothetical protein n=1 Tax=Stenotrophomonas rhizophila TaxID=216778 RepID=UPI000B89A9FC|nr:hypothetical protein [Stenotrophomonas rhizophila]